MGYYNFTLTKTVLLFASISDMNYWTIFGIKMCVVKGC